MEVVWAALVVMSMLPEVERVWAQRAPCYECEVYKDSHPQSKPYEEIRSHCSYPCECGNREPECPEGVSLVRDGCGCCPICARQQGEPCDGTTLCDEKRGLVCQYPHRAAVKGVCQAIKGLPCTVYNRTYDNGETFLLDCRTQCACQNGTYACASLCPQEYISPQGSCRHPRLVEVPGQCCREWMCDSESAQHPPDCRQEYSQWSSCSSPCGVGLSHRVSNLNPRCIAANETRLCQLRACDTPAPSHEHARHHHVRKGHECKATQRVTGPVRLRFGPCRSRKRYRPKFCGSCPELCCKPQLSTTIKVEFHCDISSQTPEDERDLLLDLTEPGTDLWEPDLNPQQEENEEGHRFYYYHSPHNHHHQPPWRPEFEELGGNKRSTRTVFLSVQWILKCHCTEHCVGDVPVLPPDQDTLGTARPTNGEGEVILHRVHRTAAP